MKRRKNSSYGRVLNMLAKDGANFEHYTQSVNNDMLSSNVVTALAAQTPRALMTPVADFRAPVSAATFDIIITRNTATLPFTLPVALFGVLDQESDYVEVISSFIPVGVTYTIARGADRKSLNFVFTNGIDTDTINVSCNQVPYVNLLIAGLDSVFKMQQNKLQISDVAQQLQFSKAISVFNKSFFGHSENDTITPNQYKSDLQNQNDIRTINQILDIDKQRSLVFQIVPVANFSVTMSSFVQKYDKGQSAVGF